MNDRKICSPLIPLFAALDSALQEAKLNDSPDPWGESIEIAKSKVPSDRYVLLLIATAHPGLPVIFYQEDLPPYPTIYQIIHEALRRRLEDHASEWVAKHIT